jgi:hypothetical protein
MRPHDYLHHRRWTPRRVVLARAALSTFVVPEPEPQETHRRQSLVEVNHLHQHRWNPRRVAMARMALATFVVPEPAAPEAEEVHRRHLFPQKAYRPAMYQWVTSQMVPPDVTYVAAPIMDTPYVLATRRAAVSAWHWYDYPPGDVAPAAQTLRRLLVRVGL